MNSNYSKKLLIKTKELKSETNDQVMPFTALLGTFFRILGLLLVIKAAEALDTELAPGIKLKVFNW